MVCAWVGGWVGGGVGGCTSIQPTAGMRRLCWLPRLGASRVCRPDAPPWPERAGCGGARVTPERSRSRTLLRPGR